MNSAFKRPTLYALPNTHADPWLNDRSEPIPLQPDWRRVLQDLTAADELSVQISNPTATLRSNGEPWYVSASGHALWLRGPGVHLGGIVSHWASAELAMDEDTREYRHVDLSDHCGRHLFRVSLTEDGTWAAFNPLLVSRWGRRGVPAGLPDPAALSADLETLTAMLDDERTRNEVSHAWFVGQPPAARHGIIDTSLLAPFLENITEQICPMRVTVGNEGVIQSSDCAFFEFQRHGGRIEMHGSSSTFSIDLTRVTQARIEAPFDQLAHWVRLFDEHDRCVASLGLPIGCGRRDVACWQSMIRALAV